MTSREDNQDMSFYPSISADDLFAAAGINPDEEREQAEAEQRTSDVLEARNLFMTSRTVGLLQTKPSKQQEVILSELAAKYLPRLTSAFRKLRTPNNAPQRLINCVGHTPYFMRFSKTPAGADLGRIQAKRVAHVELLESDDPQTNVAEICQFLSTLLAIYGLEVNPEDCEPLLKRLRQWRVQFKGCFAEQTTSRCINMLEPEGAEGREMMGLMPLMRMQLELGIERCMIKGCPFSKDDNRKELLQCSKCRTVRYCGVEHQKQDWAQHKRICFAPTF